MKLRDLHPDGIPYPNAPQEALNWVESGDARLISSPEGGVIMLSNRKLIEFGYVNTDAEDTAVLDIPPPAPGYGETGGKEAVEDTDDGDEGRFPPSEED